ncbi:SseB family protein [Streptomyces doebereineriae]|uniref:SseB family protein n=1 Tax=Streptomyces doebereineriae TaxID=3075528 RepID=A0ABU2VLS8_9ACTN|nr:SseB family protein [Streptomyces sp. DSM 41640]MDT0486205.1 SseB family protein [Streptomyces sp. DSM 41640]
MKADVANSPTGGVGALERATLAAEIHDLYDGQGDGDRLLAAFRAAALYVPFAAVDADRDPETSVADADDAQDQAMCSGEADGVRWLYAFTSTAELERFARARAEAGTDPGWASGRIRYWTVLGSRLLDIAVPAAVAESRTPAGVAVDVGGIRPLLLPPLSGVVPDQVAVDLIDRTPGARPRSAGEA